MRMVSALPLMQVRSKVRHCVKAASLPEHVNHVASTLISASSTQDHAALLTLEALPRCTTLLVSLGGVVAAGNEEEGLELVMQCNILPSLVFTYSYVLEFFIE